MTPDALQEREAAFFSDFIARWRSHIEDEISVGDVEGLAVLYVDLTRALADFKALVSDVEDRLFEVMPEKRLELPGLPIMEKRWGKDRKSWDVEGLASRVAMTALVDPETGEIPADPMVAVELVSAAFMGAFPITPSGGARVTYLRSIDIDPDEWSTSVPGRQSIQIHEAK